MSDARWTAQILLAAKLQNGFSSTFVKANAAVTKLGQNALHLGKAFLGVGAALAGLRVGEEIFRGIGEEIKKATDLSWEWSKSMTRIRSSFMANTRIGLNGRAAPSSEKSREAGIIEDSLIPTAKQYGIKPSVLSSMYRAMALAGLTPKDLAQMGPAMAQALVAKDIQDAESANELGRSLSRSILKNQPLHATRQDIGMSLGLDEEHMKALFHKAGLDGKKLGDSLPVWDRVLMLNKLMTIQFKGQAESVMASQEGAVRLRDVWKEIYEMDLGDKTKGWQADWARFIDDIAPQAEPAFKELLDTVDKFVRASETKLSKFWKDHVQDWGIEFHNTGIELSLIQQKMVQINTMWGKLFGGSGGGKLPYGEDPMGDPFAYFIARPLDDIRTALGWVTDKLPEAISNLQKWGGVLAHVASESWKQFVDATTSAWKALEKFEKSPVIKFLEDMLQPLKVATDAWNALAQGIGKVTGGQTGSDGTALSTDDNPAWKRLQDMQGTGKGYPTISNDGSRFTEFGPIIDPYKSKYYDPDSYNGIGHIDGRAFNLNSAGPGPTAMHDAWARSHYHVSPGGTYISDKDHKPHRWMDTTGSPRVDNEDFYDGGTSGSTSAAKRPINVVQHFHGVHDRDFASRMKAALHDALRTSYA
jgi:hypothetical protein